MRVAMDMNENRRIGLAKAAEIGAFKYIKEKYGINLRIWKV